MSIADEAREDYREVFGANPEPWRGPLGALRLTLAGDEPWAFDRARDECEELVRVLNEASRKPEAAPSDTDREALIAVHRQHFYTMTGRCACGHQYHGKPSPDEVSHHIVGAVLAAGFARAAQPVQVEVTDEDIQRGVKIALEEGLAGRTWPEYIRAVHDAVTTRPAALGGEHRG